MLDKILYFFRFQEHKCVLDSCRALEAEGFEVTYLPVLSSGLVDLNRFQEAIRPTTVLTSVMAVNNEIGVIQPLEEIGSFSQMIFIRFLTLTFKRVWCLNLQALFAGSPRFSSTWMELKQWAKSR